MEEYNKEDLLLISGAFSGAGMIVAAFSPTEFVNNSESLGIGLLLLIFGLIIYAFARKYGI